MSDINLLDSDVPAAASPEHPPVERAGAAVPSSDNGAPPRRRGDGLSAMVMVDLRKLAGQMGIPNISGMRKNDLIAAIKEREGPPRALRRAAAEQLPLDAVVSPLVPQSAIPTEARVEVPALERPVAPVADSARVEPATAPDQQDRAQQDRAPQDRVAQDGAQPDRAPQDRVEQDPAQQDRAPQDRDQQGDADSADRSRNRRRRPIRGGDAPRTQNDQTQNNQTRSDQTQAEQAPAAQNGSQHSSQNGGQNAPGQTSPGSREDDDESRRRGRRFRDRNRRTRTDRGGMDRGGMDRGGMDRASTDRGGTDRGSDRRDGGELEVREDDVLLPVAGILDVLDNYAFVRTSGYLSGPNDVYVSLSLVRRYSLRRGDAITGAVRQSRDGEQQRQKFNPLVRVDTINGLDVEQARNRPEFTKLTPLYPNDRLRLETEQNIMTTRVIDLIAPIGKGQRALIVSPPKAGKTMILQAIANAITTNNPECHLMVVLVDERPEEVTDMQRSVKGEVIASTFDRPPSDHTTISELAIERAKRLVEMGHDVVVLLDSITRLGRAYNLAAPASGRILSGGVDSTALYPPKRFLGAARNIEDGGSLTIFATALVETGSTMDTVIFEEFKGTGNAEIKLDRKIADKRTFPAVDINQSGTRKEELLLSPDELAIHHKLRRVLSGLETQQAIDLVLDRLRKTRTNIEFLMQVSKSTAGTGTD
ncbi:MAG: transcription termination factor Rho [Pseudonocardiaceae bacterium]